MTNQLFRTVPALLAALILLLACGDDATRVAEHLAAADALEAEQNWSDARIELKSALKLEPDNAEVNLRLGRVEAAVGNVGDALYYFEEAWRLDPGSVDAGIGIIGITTFGDRERAQAVVEELSESHPSDPRVQVAISTLALAENDVEKALVAALTAVELGPDDARAHLQLGQVHSARIRQTRLAKQEVPDDLYRDAAESFRRARELADGSDRDAKAVRMRAWVEEARTYARWPGHREEVRATLAAALEDLHDAPEDLRQEFADTSLDIARQRRDPELVRWSLERKVELDPSDYSAWGDLAILAQRADGSGVGVVDRMVASRPDDPRAHAVYARMLAMTGDTQAAIAHLEKVAPTLEGDVSPALQRLVDLHIQRGELDAARAVYEDMASRFPNSGPTLQAGAELASAEGDLARAVAQLTRWRDLHENLIALSMLAQVELRRGNAKAALAAADRALELAQAENARPRPYLCLRGQALLRQGESGIALRTLMRANRAPGPNVEGCQEALAAALYASGREEPGRKVLDQLLEKEPSRTAILLFRRHEGENDPARARTLLEGWLADHPEDAGVLARLVQLDLAAEKPDAALARARAAHERFPDSGGLHVLLARTLATTGQHETALEMFEAAIERWPEASGASEMYVSLLARLGRLDEARETFEKMHAEGSLAPGAQVMLARMRIRAGDDPGAKDLLEKALDANEDLTTAANDLAYLLARTGEDLNRATELAQEARGREPESPQIADTLGWVLHKRGLTNAALVQFDEAIELSDPQSPGWATANYHRGMVLRELGRHEEALEAMERALASGAEFPEAEDARAAIQDLDRGTG